MGMNDIVRASVEIIIMGIVFMVTIGAVVTALWWTRIGLIALTRAVRELGRLQVTRKPSC